MAQLKIDEVRNSLEKEGFDSGQLDRVEQAIKVNLPPATYNKAVIFLGLATVLLVLGSIFLTGTNKVVPDALWGAVGAGIGGLAGIFMGKE